MNEFTHDRLDCGVEYAVAQLPRRHIVAFQIRMLSGICSEPIDKLGLGRLLVETIDKGTDQKGGREISDAFDAIGATHGAGVGRETTTFSCAVLPEHFERAVALHAEFLRNPTFPEDMFETNRELALQELTSLEDDAQGLADRLLGERAFGPILGRHPLGTADTLKQITRDDLQNHWRANFHAGRMVVAVTGAVDASKVSEVFAKEFDGFGSAAPQGRQGFALEFSPGLTHQDKPLEQQQIGIAWPGVDATHEDFPVQQVMLGVLSGGMSARLFTEVREKQGLVYYVNAWQEVARGAAMLLVGASTTPDRCGKTYKTLLHEIDRLAEDLEAKELARAITGIVAQHETRGDGTRARCSELANDLFFFDRPRTEQEKISQIEAVTLEDVRRYLHSHPRDELCVVTLGPKPLDETPTSPNQQSAVSAG